MGSRERRQKEMEIRKTDIVDAAEHVFFDKGYDRATMDDVAKEAEFSKRTVYAYFSSKEQIYFEIMIRGYRLLMTSLKIGLQNGAAQNAVEEIRHIAAAFYQFYKEYPEYFKAIMEYENRALDFQNGISDQARDECYALGEEILQYLEDALKRGIAEGSLRGDLEAEKAALVLWACMLGVFNTAEKKKNYIEHYHETRPEDFITEAFRMLMRSLQAESGGNLE